MRFRFFACSIAALLMLSGLTATAMAAAPCCSITDINARTGIVTAVDTATNRTLQFKAPRRMFRSLRVGQEVHADYRARKVSVQGIAGTLAIINVRPAEPVSNPAEPVGDPAEPVGDPAEPVGDPAEPVGHPAEPVSNPAGPVAAEPVGDPAEPVGASAQAMSSAGSNPLSGKRGLPPTRVSENPGRGECADRGGEWRCTTISTGSDPGTEDDLRSCVCINR